MKPQDFVKWLEHMKLNDSAAARALGLARGSVVKYKTEEAPKYIALACAAMAYGLPAWKSVE